MSKLFTFTFLYNEVIEESPMDWPPRPKRILLLTFSFWHICLYYLPPIQRLCSHENWHGNILKQQDLEGITKGKASSTVISTIHSILPSSSVYFLDSAPPINPQYSTCQFLMTSTCQFLMAIYKGSKT
jgi:hypothetical protein